MSTNYISPDAVAWESVIRELQSIMLIPERASLATVSGDDPNGPLYSSYGNDADLADLVEMFVAEMPDRIRRLESFFQNADDERLGRAAHQMKGAVGGYGFHTITPAAAALETAVREGQPVEVVRKALDDLISLCQRVSVGGRPAGV